MAALITTKDVLLQFLKINYINDISSLPDFEMAAQTFLVPILGQDLYDQLAAAPDDDPDLTLRCRAVIAPLGYLTELPIIHSRITDTGIKKTATETMQPVF